MSEFVHRLRVRNNECDPQGIVFNPNFIMYVTIAMGELWTTQFGDWAKAIEGWGIDMVTGSATIDFKAPARPGDDLDVQVTLDNIGTTSLTYGFSITRDATLVAKGAMRYVCVDRNLTGKVPVPDGLREAVSRP